MRFLRQNTAVMVTVGPFYDKGDGVTIETSLTITNERITLTADTDAGSAPTNILDNVTGATSGTSNDLNYITGNDAGLMQLELAAADTNRVGRMFLTITDAANHVPVFHEFFVLPQAIYDWLTGVVTPLPANVTQFAGSNITAASGIPEVKVASIAANAITATAINADAITDAKVASDVTIASVTGAVGSVTGAVGSVTGAVGSVAAGGITASSIAADAIGASELAADAATEIATAVWASGTRILTALDEDTTTLDLDATIRGAVGLASANLDTQLDALPTNAELATALGTADDAVLTAIDALPTNAELATALGTADDAVLAAIAGVDAKVDTIDTNVDAILVDTNELQTDWVNGGRLDNILDARSSQTSVDDLPTNAELATALGTADDATLAQIALVKAQTDLIPASPAAVGSAMTLTSGERSAIANEVETQIIDEADAEKVLEAITDKIAAVNPDLGGLTVAAIATAVRDKAIAGAAAGSIGETLANRASQTSVDDLPTNAELGTALGTADDATLAAIAALNNLSSAQAQTAATAALNAYDPPTRTEATSDKDAVIAALPDVSDIQDVTDQFVFTDGNVGANVKAVNDVEVAGTGTTGDEWGPA